MSYIGTGEARLKCAVCKCERIVASGFVAVDYPRSRLIDCAIRINWQCVPVFKCPDCRDDKRFVWFTCKSCGKSEAVYATSREEQLTILKKKHWQIVPVIKCGGCLKYG